MKVRFLTNYRGVLTGEEFFQKGQEADLKDGQALVDAGRAEAVKAAPKKAAKKGK